MKIVIVSDAWLPQINGVVKTLEHTINHLRADGHEVLVIEPGLFRSMACPGYREIRLALWPSRRRAKGGGGCRPAPAPRRGPALQPGISTR